MIGQSSETDLEPGERVYHVREPEVHGTVTFVDENKLSVTVLWDGYEASDFQWANKVARLSGGAP